MPPEVAEESRRSRTSHVSKEGCCSGRRSSPSAVALPQLAQGIWRAGLELDQKFIFEMEMARADSPYLSSFSIKMVAPC